MTIACGIDFGTSNSTVGVLKEGQFSMVPVEDAQTTIPSAIFYPANGAPPSYGRAAIGAYTEHEPGRLMRSLKSIMGSDLINEKTGVGGRYVSFEAILVGFIRHLKAKAESYCGGVIKNVVMGRPVHFIDDNEVRDARAERMLEQIALAAGFETVLFQFEPIAAALSFESTLERDELVFIGDIGGGTSDFSVVRVGPGFRTNRDRAGDILANEGVRIGGTNLDMRLSLTSVMPLLAYGTKTLRGLDLPSWPFVDLATWHSIHTLSDPKNREPLRQIAADAKARDLFERYLKVVREQTGHRIARYVEDAKIGLTDERVAEIPLDMIEPGLAATARKSAFESAIAREVTRIAQTIDEALASAAIEKREITSVFLTGGTSAVPAVKEALIAPFPNARVVVGDQFNSVGFGLALDAERRFSRLPQARKVGGRMA